MSDLVALVVVLTALGVALGGFAWLASHARRRKVGGWVLGPFEEMWHPAAHRARIETEAQEVRAAPMPPSGGRLI